MAALDPGISTVQALVERFLNADRELAAAGLRTFEYQGPIPEFSQSVLLIFSAPEFSGQVLAAAVPDQPQLSVEKRADFGKAIESGTDFIVLKNDTRARSVLLSLKEALAAAAADQATAYLVLGRSEATHHLVTPTILATPAFLAPSPPSFSPGVAGRYPVSFYMLAMDVLSGRLKGDHFGQAQDNYEVWTYELEPRAIAILCSYDAGAATAFAAYVPQALAGDACFTEALNQLAGSRLPARWREDRLLLKRVTGENAFHALAGALSSLCDGQGLVVEPGLLGHASSGTLTRLESLSGLEGGLPQPSAIEPLFVTLASLFWSKLRVCAIAESGNCFKNPAWRFWSRCIGQDLWC